jgi:outer membrane lipoprotein-sorting protein
MRRVATLAIALVSAVLLSGAVIAPGGQFNDAQKATLDRVSAYLNSVHTLKGSFVQIDPNGQVEQGDFFIEKPGRMRFEYHPPAPTLIVSDGNTVAVKNNQLNTVDRYPLADTPLDIILSNDIDLRHNVYVTGIDEEEGSLVIRARSNNNKSQGDIAIYFSQPQLELRQWTIKDAQGLSTTVSLRDVQSGTPLAGSLFVLQDAKNPFTRKTDE